MKKKLGISLYPTGKSLERDKLYLEQAAGHGFSVLFLAMLGITEGREAALARFAPLTHRAKELGYEIFVDVNPAVFKQLGVNASLFQAPIDLSFFAELQVDALRLDYGMSVLEEAYLTKNKEGIKICMNAGSKSDHVGNVIAAGGDVHMLVGCHNYYPHRYTGIDLEHFQTATSIWNRHNIRCQAFISTQEENAFGPHALAEGLPTLEIHRDLPIQIQFKHLKMMDMVDDILIGNCYASEAELAALQEANTDCVEFHIELAEGLPESMRKRLGMQLSRRNDANNYLVRTLESRLLREDTPPFHTVDIKRGDILIDNDLYGQYSGEVQIALRDLKNSGKTNVVGHILAEEVMLLDYLAGGQSFVFQEGERA
ncbi:DUF871 domain-containing protein [Allofournierella sp.]|uniref:DUF871 domain-containing protein n=1 Tax=Allofournierella sp. TaxID=1940256 RepID=UPI003AF0EB9A